MFENVMTYLGRELPDLVFTEEFAIWGDVVFYEQHGYICIIGFGAVPMWDKNRGWRGTKPITENILTLLRDVVQ